MLFREYKSERAAKCAATKLSKVFTNKSFTVAPTHSFYAKDVVWQVIEQPIVRSKIGWIN